MRSSHERAEKKLKERDFKLNTLLEVSNAVNNLEYGEELYQHFKEILTNKLSLGKGLLLSDTNGWAINIQFGEKVINVENLAERCFGFERITVLSGVDDPILSEFDVIIPIVHKSKALSYLLLGDFVGEKIEVSPIIRHLPFIQTLTNLIVVAQENKRLFEESIERAALQKEIELASKMQSMLIPEKFPERIDLDICALYQPHQIVGGDYYDFFQINENQTVFCMADVSGKGISAAMLMSNFQAMMHALMDSDNNLRSVINSLNYRVSSNAKGEKFITAFVAIYDHTEREITYVNSGHQPALFCHEGTVLELDTGSSVLGAFEELPHLNVGKQKVSVNDILICFTDGVCEVVNKDEVEFGTNIMKSMLPNYKSKSSKMVVDAIMDEIDAFKGEVEFPDDLALLGVRFT